MSKDSSIPEKKSTIPEPFHSELKQLLAAHFIGGIDTLEKVIEAIERGQYSLLHTLTFKKGIRQELIDYLLNNGFSPFKIDVLGQTIFEKASKAYQTQQVPFLDLILRSNYWKNLTDKSKAEAVEKLNNIRKKFKSQKNNQGEDKIDQLLGELLEISLPPDCVTPAQLKKKIRNQLIAKGGLLDFPGNVPEIIGRHIFTNWPQTLNFHLADYITQLYQSPLLNPCMDCLAKNIIHNTIKKFKAIIVNNENYKVLSRCKTSSTGIYTYGFTVYCKIDQIQNLLTTLFHESMHYLMVQIYLQAQPYKSSDVVRKKEFQTIVENLTFSESKIKLTGVEDEAYKNLLHGLKSEVYATEESKHSELIARMIEVIVFLGPVRGEHFLEIHFPELLKYYKKYVIPDLISYQSELQVKLPTEEKSPDHKNHPDFKPEAEEKHICNILNEKTVSDFTYRELQDLCAKAVLYKLNKTLTKFLEKNHHPLLMHYIQSIDVCEVKGVEIFPSPQDFKIISGQKDSIYAIVQELSEDQMVSNEIIENLVSGIEKLNQEIKEIKNETFEKAINSKSELVYQILILYKKNITSNQLIPMVEKIINLVDYKPIENFLGTIREYQNDIEKKLVQSDPLNSSVINDLEDLKFILKIPLAKEKVDAIIKVSKKYSSKMDKVGRMNLILMQCCVVYIKSLAKKSKEKNNNSIEQILKFLHRTKPFDINPFILELKQLLQKHKPLAVYLEKHGVLEDLVEIANRNKSDFVYKNFSSFYKNKTSSNLFFLWKSEETTYNDVNNFLKQF